MTVGLSLNYTDSIWQGILSHLKRLLPLKSQVCSSCCSHPQIARDFRQPRVMFFFGLHDRKQVLKLGDAPILQGVLASICWRLRRELVSLSSFLSPGKQPFMSDRNPTKHSASLKTYRRRRKRGVFSYLSMLVILFLSLFFVSLTRLRCPTQSICCMPCFVKATVNALN